MITAEEMRKLEYDTVQKGTPLSELMENAGRKVFETVKEKYDLTRKHVIIFAGHGNNGGDGFVAARYFTEECFVTVLFFGWEDNLKDETRENFNKIKDKINIININKKEDLDEFHVQDDLDLILIDALLGTGVKGAVREPLSWGIDYFNSLEGIKVSVDIPSGMEPDTGEGLDKCCESDLIVCFHDIKKGLEKIKEKVTVVDIGLGKL